MRSRWWLDQHPLTSAEGDLFEVGGACRELAQRLQSCHRPDAPGGPKNLIVSLEGNRGSGRTSFANLLLEELQRQETEQEGLEAPIDVRFELGWSGAAELSIWSALAYRIGESLYRRFHQRCLESGRRVEIASPLRAAHEPEPARIKVKTKPFGDPRLHWLAVARRLSDAISREHWSPCLNLFSEAPSKIPGRRLGWNDSRNALTHAAEGLVAGFGAAPANAIEKGGKAARALLKKRLVEGPTWGVDTTEFVRELGVLLRVFHPRPSGWSAVIVLDDLNRIEAAEVRGVQETLDSLRRLDGVLVLVVLDPRAGRLLEHRVPAAHTSRSAEPSGDQFDEEVNLEGLEGRDGLHALIDLRLPIPTPAKHEVIAMTRRFIEELKLPISQSEVSHFARRLRSRGILRPRETKRALLWLWMRLGRPGSPTTLLTDRAGEPLAPRHRLGMLEVLLDLHLFIENRLGAANLLETAEKHFPVLAHFPVRPWNLRGWTDRQRRNLSLWEGSRHSSQRDLILVLRLISLGELAGTGHMMSGHRARARELWNRCRNEVIEWDPLRLGAMTDPSARALMTHLEIQMARPGGLARPLALGHLVSASRRFDVAEQNEPDGEGLRLVENWFDSDLLTMTFRHKEGSRSDRRRAWVLLNLLHPLTAEMLVAVPDPEDWPEEDRGMLMSLAGQRETLIDILRGNL